MQWEELRSPRKIRCGVRCTSPAKHLCPPSFSVNSHHRIALHIGKHPKRKEQRVYRDLECRGGTRTNGRHPSLSYIPEHHFAPRKGNLQFCSDGLFCNESESFKDGPNEVAETEMRAWNIFADATSTNILALQVRADLKQSGRLSLAPRRQIILDGQTVMSNLGQDGSRRGLR
jgi:hypothetical protein